MEDIRKKIASLEKKYPGWEQKIAQFLNDEIEELDDDIVLPFQEILNSLAELVRSGKSTANEALAVFSPGLREPAERFFRKLLRPYFGCELLRRCDEKQYKQMEYLIDELWQQHVLRRDPRYQHDKKLTEDLVQSKEELEEFSTTLVAIADTFIANLLTYDAMVRELKERVGLPTEFCHYIARKIDRDYEELRGNLIIKRLMELSR